MDYLPYIIGIFFAIFVVYKIVSLLYFILLKARLRNGDFKTFVKILGENHQHRLLLNGLIRYKWSQGWINVKANFDENGKLIRDKTLPIIIFKLKSELLFFV